MGGVVEADVEIELDPVEDCVLPPPRTADERSDTTALNGSPCLRTSVSNQLACAMAAMASIERRRD